VAQRWEYIGAGIILLVVGIAAYLWRRARTGEWHSHRGGRGLSDVTVAGDIFVDLILGGFTCWLSRARKFFQEIIAGGGRGRRLRLAGWHGWIEDFRAERGGR